MGNRTRSQLPAQQAASLTAPKPTQPPGLFYLLQKASQAPSFVLCLFCQSRHTWLIEHWDPSALLTEGRVVCFRLKGQITNTLMKRDRKTNFL